MTSESFPAAIVAIPDDIPHDTRSLATGDLLVSEGETGDNVIVIESGTARVAAGANSHVLADLGPGDIIGEVTALAGGTRTASVEAITPMRVHVLTRQAFESLMDQDSAFAEHVIGQAADRLERRHMLAFLERLLGHLDRDVVSDFEKAIEWISLDAGQELYRKGDVAGAGYFLISGRLQEIGADEEGWEAVVREIARDELVGEAGLFKGEHRQTTVVAARDSRLVKIAFERFLDLAKLHPSALVPVISDMARRSGGTRDSNRQRSIAVCVTADIDGRVFVSRLVGEVEKLGTTSHLWAARTDALLGRVGIAQADRTDPGDIRVAELLHEHELDHTYLVCEADRTATEWTTRLGRQADLAVAVVDPHPSEAAIDTVDRFFASASNQTRRVVVVAHPPETSRPRGVRAASARWHPHQVLNIRPNSIPEVARLARILGGWAVSLVLGGGGARGFAHVGVRRAMEELAIPIDMIGGSSIGSPLGAGIAMDVPMSEYTDTVAERFSGLLDYTIPVVSLVKGERITKSIELVMSGWDFEDLWRPFFCMSTNLTRAEAVIHDSGDLNRAVRASVAIPGVIPPVAEGEDLLVDGGVLDNLPAGVMRRRNPGGTVIAVDVAPPTGPRAKGDPGLSVSGWQALLAKAKRGKTEYPGIAAMLLRTMITASVRERQRTVERGDIDLYLDLDLRGISLLDFDSVRPVADSGYEAAMPRLEAWLTQQGKD